MEKNIMLVLLGYFLIAATVSVTASAIVGLVLTNLLVGRFTKANRPSKSHAHQSKLGAGTSKNRVEIIAAGHLSLSV
jgi:multidrug efflux pump subunit AcrB